MLNNTVRKNFKKVLDLLIVGLFIFALTSCASTGGGTQSSATPSQVSTTTDGRIAFASWVDTYTPNNDKTSSEVSVVYNMSAFTTTGLPAKTEKYYIEDYGFFQTTINGTTDRNNDTEEGSTNTNFIQTYDVFESDINGDGHQDFYLMHWAGDGNSPWLPDSNLFAWINDGNGHFTLDQSIFADGTQCFMGSMCANDSGNPTGMLVADFNNDGMDDVYQNITLLLSNNNKLYNKSNQLPNIFDSCENNCWSHDADYGDADGDGDLDIFIPVWDSYADENLRHQGVHPWIMMINDGNGNFVSNTKFPDMGMFGHDNFATSAVVADFDNDGHGDVAVGWQRPGSSQYQNQVTNSAGAVFYNDGTNDWRNRTVVELPANYFGANGMANDMKAFDFDGDGYVDIVLAITKHNPYYEGRYIQFFKNTNGTNFIDVSSTANPNTKYAYGNGTSFWNGDGDLILVDFDHDGDMDIVDVVRGTYALINNGDGTYTMYDDFPQFGDLAKYYPVEIDGKFWYDFIGATNSTNNVDTDKLTFFQVLDPPSYAEMYQDIMTKPQGYAETIFKSKLLLDDLRKQTRGTKVFGETVEDSNLVAFNKELGNGWGFTVGKLSGASEGEIAILDKEIKQWHIGLSFVKNKLEAHNDTMWFGTGNADVKYETITNFIEYLQPINNNMYATFGFEVSTTAVDSFEEQMSDYNVAVKGFDVNDAKVFADVNYRLHSKYGTTNIGLGIDHYKTIGDTSIDFADILSYNYNQEMTVGKFNVSHTFKNFYLQGNFNTENYNSIELGYFFQF